MKTSRTVVGVDTAKRVFQLHWVDMEKGEIVDLKLTRAKFLEHFANRVPCVVAMEACGGSQHWARQLRELGHDPWLLPAKAVRPFVAGNKNDAQDARAIWTAAQMPGVRTVAVKSEEQQGVLALHRMRQQLVKFRTAQINGLRGLLTEYGEVMPQGRAGMRRGMAGALERVSERLPAMIVDTFREQWARVGQLDEEIGQINFACSVGLEQHRCCVAEPQPFLHGAFRDPEARRDGGRRAARIGQAAERLDLIGRVHGGADTVLGQRNFFGRHDASDHAAGHGVILFQRASGGQRLHRRKPPTAGDHRVALGAIRAGFHGTGNQVLKQPVGCDRGLELGEGRIVGRRLAHIVG